MSYYTPPKFNSEFTPEKLQNPNRKPDRLPTKLFSGATYVKLRGSGLALVAFVRDAYCEMTIIMES